MPAFDRDGLTFNYPVDSRDNEVPWWVLYLSALC